MVLLGKPPVFGSGTANGANQDLVASQNCSIGATVSVQLTGTWAGTITFQCSNDGTNWVSMGMYNTSSNNAAAVTTTTGNGIFCGVVPARFFRARMTAYTSGTAVSTLHIFSEHLPIPFIGGQVNVGGNPVLGGGTNTVGGIRLVADSGNGSGTLHHLVSAATTNATSVKTSAGNIGALTVSNGHATNACFFKLYNLTTAPTVGTSTPVQVVRVPANSTVSVETGPFGIRCSTGIAYALTGAAANSDTTAVGANDVVVAMAYT